MKKVRKIAAVLMALCMVMSLMPVGTLATEDAPELVDGYYEIYTADQLYWFAEQVNSGNTAINGKLMVDIVVNENVLKADGTLNGDGSNFRVWTPIGNTWNRYSGVFEGNGKCISGLYHNDDSAINVGFFAYVDSGAVMQNLGILDTYMRGKENVGAIVGYAFSCSVINCFNAGTIRAYDYAGGVVGRIHYSTVDACYNMGRVVAGSQVGGVISTTQNVTVSNCYNIGRIHGRDCVGGVIGDNDSNISNCYNMGVFDYLLSGGGVVGSNTGTISNCYNTSDIINCYSHVGGIVGQNAGYITNCYNTGNIRGSTYIGGGKSSIIGGVAGYNSGTMTNCYNFGNVSGAWYVGGVVGSYISTIPENCFYLVDCAKDAMDVTQFGVGYWWKGGSTADKPGQTIGMTAEQFASGEVAYLLQGEQSEQIWGQTIGVDPYPMLSESKVYCITDGETVFGYSNVEGQLPVLGVTVSGNVTSYLDGDATVELVQDGEVVYSTTVSGGSYVFEGVAAGEYTLRISKDNHAPMEFAITVGDGAVTQDAILCPVGDVTGDGVVNIKDFQRLLRHVNKTNPLTDYELACGDVTGDGVCNIKDFQRLLRHVNKTNPLF